LAKGYERFYTQVFNLATGNLRLIASEKDTEKKDNKELKPSRFARRKTTSKSDYSPSQSIIAQPLSNIFLKSYKSARDNLSEKTLWNSVSLKSNFWQKLISGNKLLGIIPLDIKPKIPTIRQNLNASEIELNGVYLTNADFDYAWLRDAQIKDSNLTSVNFHTAVLENCFISDTDLSESVFTNANIQKAYFLRAILNNAVFTDSKAESVKFEDLTAENVIFLNATLKEAKFIHVKFVGGNFKGADLSDATFNEIEFCRFNEVQPNIEMAILKNTVFNGVKGLTKDQLAKCRENGATFVGYTE